MGIHSFCFLNSWQLSSITVASVGSLQHARRTRRPFGHFCLTAVRYCSEIGSRELSTETRRPVTQKAVACATEPDTMWTHVIAAWLLWVIAASSGDGAGDRSAAIDGGSTQSIDEIRQSDLLRFGPVYVKPAIRLKELGVDSNVFNQSVDEKSDFTFTVSPQADLALPIARLGLVRSTVGTDLVYFAQYASERSVDPRVLGAGRGLRAAGHRLHGGVLRHRIR
jgi:hypothetical protein